jgi:hypothetical protein
LLGGGKGRPPVQQFLREGVVGAAGHALQGGGAQPRLRGVLQPLELGLHGGHAQFGGGGVAGVVGLLRQARPNCL